MFLFPIKQLYTNICQKSYCSLLSHFIISKQLFYSNAVISEKEANNKHVATSKWLLIKRDLLFCKEITMSSLSMTLYKNWWVMQKHEHFPLLLPLCVAVLNLSYASIILHDSQPERSQRSFTSTVRSHRYMTEMQVYRSKISHYTFAKLGFSSASFLPCLLRQSKK